MYCIICIISLSAIKASINGINEEISTLKTSTNEKITAIETTIKTLAGKDELASKVTEITQAYTTAIASATNNITTAYDKAIKDAIAASENGMKGWVNDTLAQGQKVLELNTESNKCEATETDLLGGTEFCGCTFKQIVLSIEIDTREMSTEQIELAVKTAVENGAIDLTIKFKSNAGVEEFNAALTAIQLSNWKECLNLTVTGVTEISTTVFYNYGWLKSITFGDGITTLGGEYTVMNFCGSLECATIGKSVTAINGTVFYDCASLEKIVYDGTVAEWNAITKVGNWVKECPSVTEVVCSDGTITL